MTSPVATQPAEETAPLDSFARCHEGILAQLKRLDQLPHLLAQEDRARQIAEDTLAFFRSVVFDHHGEEEKDLFPAVLSAAAKGEEKNRVEDLVEALKQEHRSIEALWRQIEPALSHIAKARPPSIDAGAIRQLVQLYTAHAVLEEEQFLPLSEQILGRESPKMAALGLSLHIRHVVRAARRGLRGS